MCTYLCFDFIVEYFLIVTNCKNVPVRILLTAPYKEQPLPEPLQFQQPLGTLGENITVTVKLIECVFQIVQIENM